MVSAIDFRDQAALDGLVSEQFTDWSAPVRVTQAMIDAFAELTGDTMWLHVDVERCAKESPFRKTIAHGFLILSLLPKMPTGADVTRQVAGYRHMMNYGSDRLRFLNPVTVDSEIRARSRIVAAEVGEKKTRITMEIHVQAIDQDKPALIYDLAFVFM